MCLPHLPLEPSFAPFPTYPVSLFLKGLARPQLSRQSSSLNPSCLGDDQDVVNFNQRFKENNTIKGLPRFDPKRLVHASQTIEILKPLPLVSGPGWRIKKRLAAIRENSAFFLLPNLQQNTDPARRVRRHHRERTNSRRPERRHLRASLRSFFTSHSSFRPRR